MRPSPRQRDSSNCCGSETGSEPMRASSLQMRGDGGRRWLRVQKVARPIPETSRSQRHTLASTHQSRDSQHERTHRTFQSRWQKTGWGDASPLGTRKIHRMGRNDRAHLCCLLYITHQSGEGESAAVLAANRNTLKYEALPSSFIFQPVAIETMGRYNPSALAFIGEIGRRTSAITGDRRETTFLFQRLSICIQRYNLVALKGTYPSTQEDEF